MHPQSMACHLVKASELNNTAHLQILLALYAFLAGIAVSQSQRLWVMPLATAVYWILLGATDIIIGHICGLNPGLKR